MSRIAAFAILMVLTACSGEWPQERRDREQREDTLRWLEQQEISRQDRERAAEKQTPQ